MNPIKGRCLCGAIEVALTPPTDFMSHCHCESCRRTHAAAFVTWTAVPHDRFKITWGKPKLHKSSHHATRGFCADCGTPLTYVSTDWPGKTYVPVACLVDKMDREPESHIHYAEKVPWIELGDALPKHPRVD